MPWVDQSSAFGFGTQLTSTQMQNLRDNITAQANGDPGAPKQQPAGINGDVWVPIQTVAVTSRFAVDFVDIPVNSHDLFKISVFGATCFVESGYLTSLTMLVAHDAVPTWEITGYQYMQSTNFVGGTLLKGMPYIDLGALTRSDSGGIVDGDVFINHPGNASRNTYKSSLLSVASLSPRLKECIALRASNNAVRSIRIHVGTGSNDYFNGGTFKLYGLSK